MAESTTVGSDISQEDKSGALWQVGKVIGPIRLSQSVSERQKACLNSGLTLWTMAESTTVGRDISQEDGTSPLHTTY